jgi:ribosomal protein L37AE/L43A
MLKWLKRCPVCLNERLRPRGPGHWSCPECGADMALTEKGLTTRPGRLSKPSLTLKSAPQFSK